MSLYSKSWSSTYNKKNLKTCQILVRHKNYHLKLHQRNFTQNDSGFVYKNLFCQLFTFIVHLFLISNDKQKLEIKLMLLVYKKYQL